MSRAPHQHLAQVTGMVHYQTEKALKFSLTGDEKTAIWLPKSQCDFVWKKTHREKIAVITMPEWLAVRSGLV